MRILVTGASGLLGLNFALQYCGQHSITGLVNGHNLAGVPFEVCRADLVQPGTAQQVIQSARPDLILHCAAIANLDTCETHPDLAQRLNAEVPGEIAVIARRSGIQMIHVSTDAVFDGLHGRYTEQSAARPINVYARTKLEGEKAVAEANPEAIIGRVNFYGWSLSGNRSLGEFFFNNLRAGKRTTGFTDIWFCPLQVNLLGELLMKMAVKGLSGLYHTVSRECLSKYEFGCRVARQFGLDESLVIPVSWLEGNLAAPRSPNLSLRTDKLEKALGETLPDQSGGLKLFYAQYREGFAERILKLSR
ncbi:MAG TPA: SDR family oxidoreductase [Anaerolineaceae bacterium]|nr:SDR family oxidoreductase [Anaerolineaceae bacterium]